MDIEHEMLDAKERIAKLEVCVTGLTTTLARIEGSVGTTEMLVKWVILPLIIIVGAIIGVKVAMPT